MYLISLYFDKNTENHIQHFIHEVAKQSGNVFMVDKKVPPHITVSAFETLREEEIAAALDNIPR